MGLPKVLITQGNGNLGRLANSLDGVAALIIGGVAVADKLTLGEAIVLYAPEEAAVYGITPEYDETNSVLVYQHIADFYAEAELGAELHLMVVPQAETLESMVDPLKAFAAKLLKDQAGRIRLLGIVRNPTADYVPVVADGLDQDVLNAITKAHALRIVEEEQYRYCSFIIEGRSFSGNIGSLADLRAADGPNANRVSVCLDADPELTDHVGYARVGLLLGRLARIPVQRNAGRVLDGAVVALTAGLSNGAAINTYTDVQLDTLNDKGYIFLRKHPETAGFFYNDDHTATPLTDDYSGISRGRVMDKASRIVRQVYVIRLLDDIEVDATTGKMLAAEIKSYQAEAQTQIERQMLTKGEISGVAVTVDPEQNILSTDEVATEVELVPKGIARKIKSLIKYSNPFNN